MHLGPREIEKLMLHQACFLAQKRYARGLKLNYTEAVALISGQLLEYIRDGRKVAELMELGKNFLGINDVMPGVPEMIHEVQVEGTFPDGSKLVTVHHPICLEYGQEDLALYSSGLTRRVKPEAHPDPEFVPGETFVQEGDINLNESRKVITLNILNTGDRPIQVGSHYPFIEANRALEFDRKSSYGFRLNIAAGTAIRFEPGESKDVELVAFGGAGIYKGGSAQIQGQVSEADLDELMAKMKANGFKGCEVKA